MKIKEIESFMEDQKKSGIRIKSETVGKRSRV